MRFDEKLFACLYEKKTKGLKGIKFRTFIGRFQVTSWVNKGINQVKCRHRAGELTTITIIQTAPMLLLCIVALLESGGLVGAVCNLLV